MGVNALHSRPQDFPSSGLDSEIERPAVRPFEQPWRKGGDEMGYGDRVQGLKEGSLVDDLPPSPPSSFPFSTVSNWEIRIPVFGAPSLETETGVVFACRC